MLEYDGSIETTNVTDSRFQSICETLTVHLLKRMYGSQHCGSEARNTYMMHEHMKLPSVSMQHISCCWVFV